MGFCLVLVLFVHYCLFCFCFVLEGFGRGGGYFFLINQRLLIPNQAGYLPLGHILLSTKSLCVLQHFFMDNDIHVT